MALNAESYKGVLLMTKRGNSHGVFSNAKPIFVISIIDGISEGVIVGNKIEYTNESLQEIYKRNYISLQNDGSSLYRANTKITPYNMPFFHLNAESYYHIKWKESVNPPQQAQSPSGKYLSENVMYAFIDNELWDILQEAEIRFEFRNSLVKKFLTSTIV